MLMRTIALACGDSLQSFSFEPERFTVLDAPETGNDDRTRLDERLVGSPPLPELCRGKRVLVVVSDLTRPTGTREFLPRLLAQLERAATVKFIYSTGIHRPLEPEEKSRIVGPDVFRAYPMLDHDPERGNTHVGDTSFGNRVEVDDHLIESQLVVLTGTIGFHYFAGFSGGRKSVLPGIASRRSIEFNHLLVLNRSGKGRNPDVRVARMEGNPVHEDMVEGARLTGRDYFLYNTILDASRQVARIYTGDWLEAHRQGAGDYLETHSVQIPERRRLAIVSCGGYPRDINMIQAHKALEFAQHAVTDGGTIILLGECREGMGHPSFFHWFQNDDGSGSGLDRLESALRERYEVYGQTAYSMRSKTRRFRVIGVTSLDPAQVRAMGMEPAASLASALEMADVSLAAEPGYVLPHGAEVLPVTSD
jgi:nickel-dependent lactate racemase